MCAFFSIETALAGDLPNENDSWEMIRGNKNVIMDAPDIQMWGVDDWSVYSIFSVCHQGDELFLKSGKDTTICLDNTAPQYLNKGSGVCLFKKDIILHHPLQFSRPACLQPSPGKNANSCLKWGEEFVSTPTIYEIEVREFFSGFGKSPGRIGKLLFTKEYEVPMCGLMLMGKPF